MLVLHFISLLSRALATDCSRIPCASVPILLCLRDWQHSDTHQRKTNPYSLTHTCKDNKTNKKQGYRHKARGDGSEESFGLCFVRENIIIIITPHIMVSTLLILLSLELYCIMKELDCSLSIMTMVHTMTSKINGLP